MLTETSELVVANAHLQALWEIDLDAEKRKRTRAQVNILCFAVDRTIGGRMVNWDEIVSQLIGTLKAYPQFESLDDPRLYFDRVLSEVAGADPQLVGRMIDLWASAPAVELRVRWNYRLTWNDPAVGEMRFHGIESTASEPEGLFFEDWHPLDAETWEALEQVKARRRRGRNR